MTTISASLPPDLAQFVEGEVAAGRYPSSEEMIREGVRLLRKRHEQTESLREMIRVGLEQIERGEYIEFDEDGLDDFFDQIEAEALRRLEADHGQVA